MRSLSLSALVLLGAAEVAAQDAVTVTRKDQRTVPLTAYLPKRATCRGVAVISPGAGGSERGYQYLGEAMASMTLLAVVVGHQESGRLALRQHMVGHGLRQGLLALITDPDAYRGRFLDIAAAKQWAAAKCNGGKSVLIGHSMGAATTMMEAGARNRLGVKGSNGFTAYVALSPQGPGPIFPHQAWSTIKRPVLSITGTRDRGLDAGSWTTRTQPFTSMPAGCKWLAVLDGATHMDFAGQGLSRRTEALTIHVIGAFLAGLDRGDCKAPRWRHGMNVQSK